MNWREKYRELALQALTKKSIYGSDIDINKFIDKKEEEVEINEEIKSRALEVGIELSQEKSGTYLQIDHSVILSKVASNIKGLEILPTDEALLKYDWLRSYYWKAISVDQDKYTAIAELKSTKGYFIRVAPYVRITQPIQACLYIHSQGLLQAPHNIIIAEEGSEVNIITGCTIGSKVNYGLHIGISEFYVKKNAKVIFTMIHSWNEGMYVRPRTGVIIEDDGVFVSNYILLKPVRDLQAYPTAYLIGKNAKAKFNSIIYGSQDSIIDLGSRIILMNEGCSGESIFKVVATGNAKVYNRGQIIGQNRNTKGHLECRGMILCPTASIVAIPELVAEHSETELSHEAAIGKLQEEQLNYLMARGIPPDDAIGILVKGFLDPGLPGIPEILQSEIRRKILTTIRV
ncbi:MAG: SufD family Fe-S cluster assembly protein [Candidatus Verstraetearchaeota archaeon]|jgi:Fe-S cluster assembly scaffold protein SufB|nr:SufD family Fe-S cluster assembly protein [Candidatus Verstraetearchaeota archaeon]